ncbi:MAG: hypothetical protein D6813_15885 [Calditrichaeota bacterium]|nr:MAG: hypothetical protein D6813_15885 [Calditrichota bacterium]
MNFLLFQTHPPTPGLSKKIIDFNLKLQNIVVRDCFYSIYGKTLSLTACFWTASRLYGEREFLWGQLKRKELAGWECMFLPSTPF